MKELINKLLAHDKLKHFFLGFFIFISFSVLLGNLSAFVITTFIGLFYEIYQQVSKEGEPEFLDALYTALPAILIYLASVL